MARASPSRKLPQRLLIALWGNMSRPADAAVLEIMIGSRSDAELAKRLGPVQHQLEINRQNEMVRPLAAHCVDGFASDLIVQRLAGAAIRGLTIDRMFTRKPATLAAALRGTLDRPHRFVNQIENALRISLKRRTVMR